MSRVSLHDSSLACHERKAEQKEDTMCSRGLFQRVEADDVCTQLWLQSYLLLCQHAGMQVIDDLLLGVTAVLWGGLA